MGIIYLVLLNFCHISRTYLDVRICQKKQKRNIWAQLDSTVLSHQQNCAERKLHILYVSLLQFWPQQKRKMWQHSIHCTAQPYSCSLIRCVHNSQWLWIPFCRIRCEAFVVVCVDEVLLLCVLSYLSRCRCNAHLIPPYKQFPYIEFPAKRTFH